MPGQYVGIEDPEQTYRAHVTADGALKVDGSASSGGTSTADQGAAGTDPWLVTVSGTTTVSGTVGISGTVPVSGTVTTTTADVTAVTSLAAVTADALGTPLDAGVPMTTCTVIATSASELAGTIIIQGSHDGTTWVMTNATVPLPAAGTVTVSVTGMACRYWRAGLSEASGAGTVTATIMAA
ncbi:hypothetical protein [Streptomyces johnsoniae]|uniref:Uncharacterized protein n=1 Tax=Streptomyces johnsoniae TaxID=3075532 RepID=A0ABU2S1K4_9ACTN|nr:hypothetical protein [Streptomyces sp. DSM 41886]MDT0442324.1 hypothetical protein [Streptomyces sp. DSM 41886]